MSRARDTIEAIAEAARQRATKAAAERIGEALDDIPGIDVTAEPEGVTIRAPGLAKRLLRDPRLRWLASLLK